MVSMELPRRLVQVPAAGCLPSEVIGPPWDCPGWAHQAMGKQLLAAVESSQDGCQARFGADEGRGQWAVAVAAGGAGG